MKRAFYYLGIFTFLFGLGYGIDYAYQNHEVFLTKFFFFLGVAFSIGIIIWSVLRLKYGKNWMIGSGKDLLIGSDLIGAMNKTLDELPKPSKPTLSLLGAHLVYRFTRIGIIGLLIASIPIVLLWQQNKKMDIQNNKMDIQNNKINIQNALIEAERRSSLVFLMSNVLDKVDDEIKEQQKDLTKKKIKITDRTKYALSKPLINRIVALSKTFKPYKMLVGDTLSSELVSPERGQLFSALMQNNLDPTTQQTIARNGSFSKAIIGKLKLVEADLRGADLRGADLHQADLRYANLRYANLSGADLSRADLGDTDLIRANLIRANLSRADLSRADLSEADLRYAGLSHTNLDSALLSHTSLGGADLRYAHFHGADLSGADLSDADLSDAGLHGANLGGVVLNGANLNGANLGGATITKEALLEAKTLFDSRNLSIDLVLAVEEEKPCLFTEEGCQ